jgi:hypothetical protein
MVDEVGQAPGPGVRAVGASLRRRPLGEGIPCTRQKGARTAQGSSADAGHLAALRVLVAVGGRRPPRRSTPLTCCLIDKHTKNLPIQTVRQQLFLVSADALQDFPAAWETCWRRDDLSVVEYAMWASTQRRAYTPALDAPTQGLASVLVDRCSVTSTLRSCDLLPAGGRRSLTGLCAAGASAVEGFPWPGRPHGWTQLGGRSPGLRLAAAVLPAGRRRKVRCARSCVKARAARSPAPLGPRLDTRSLRVGSAA